MRSLATAVAVFVVVLLVASATSAQTPEKRWCFGPEIWLDMVNANPWVINYQQDSGWQITASMVVRECYLEGIGTASVPPLFPSEDDTGWIVLDDPDNCPSFVNFGNQILEYQDQYCFDPPHEGYVGCTPPDWFEDSAWPAGQPKCPDGDYAAWTAAVQTAGFAWPKDETWVEITPGLSILDALPLYCTAECLDEETRPMIWNRGTGWEKIPVGPDLGLVGDDIRYGRWRRMPGLVVIADHGPGVITTPPGATDVVPASDFFDRPSPYEAYNLAGFFGSATYSLMGGTKQTSLQAHINVPKELFTPIVLVDNKITNPTTDYFGVECVAGDGLYRMDGGPLTCRPGGFSNHDVILGETVVTVRVFMVDGVAPDVLIDQDNDGDVDIRDARYMGLKPVSNQQIFRFTQFHEDVCGPYFDFDGNGEAATCVLPTRPGDITRPPR